MTGRDGAEPTDPTGFGCSAALAHFRLVWFIHFEETGERGARLIKGPWTKKQRSLRSQQPGVRRQRPHRPKLGGVGRRARGVGGVLVFGFSTRSCFDSEHVSACQVSAESEAWSGMEGVGGEWWRTGGQKPAVGPPQCHARPPPFRGPRAPLSVGGLAGSRGCAGVAAARPCARSSPPRAAAGLQAALLPPPPAALERAGCSLNRQRPEGEGCEVSAPTQAPPPRGQPLGACGETLWVGLRLGSPPSVRRGGDARWPLAPSACVGVGELSPLSLADGGVPCKGGGAPPPSGPASVLQGRCGAPPPGLGRAWAGPVLLPSGKSESSGLGPGK